MLTVALSPMAQRDRLNADLLAHDSATAVLQALCDDRAPLGTPIRARLIPATPDAGADAVARRALGVGRGEPIRHRRVELTCGERVFSRADNWYLPARLTPQMNTLLETTQTPFGVVAAPLRFHRRTLSVKRLNPRGPAVLRHRAVLLDADGKPFSLVQETYTDQTIAP